MCTSSRKFTGNLKKCKLKKGKENLYKVLGKFYFKFDKTSNKICEILKKLEVL